ncbi:MAG TPA: hypothetical protein VGF98_00530 [Candidatus Tumulicola sp.]
MKKLEIIFFVATCAVAFVFHPIFAYSVGWSVFLLGALLWLVLFGFLAFFFIFAKSIPVPLPYWAIVVSVLAGGDLLCPYFRSQGIFATPFCLIPYGFPFAFAGAWSVAAARKAWIRTDARLVAVHAAVPFALYAALWGGSAIANAHELSQLQREFSAQMRAGTPAAHLLMDADIICPCWTAIAYYPRRLGSRGVVDYVRDVYAGSDCEGTAENIINADFYWVHVDCFNLPTTTPGPPAHT